MMVNSKLKTPILFLIFNRPVFTFKVFQSIRQVKPQKLYIAADGPRKDKQGEDQICNETREILKHIDWDCEVKTLLRDENLGCKLAVYSAITWFFQNEEDGIILEDDCLPDISFFKFCEELLEFYRFDNRISQIAGVNFQFNSKEEFLNSYYFSSLSHIWGWATWKRAWLNYDVNLDSWPEIKNNRYLEGILGKKKFVNAWTNIFDQVHRGEIDTWDYQWTFTCWINSGLTIIPSVNLVRNIGFGVDATHTIKSNKFSNMTVGEIRFPLVHPKIIVRDFKADLNVLNDSSSSLISRLLDKILTLVKKY